MTRAAAALCAGVSAWLSLGTLGMTAGVRTGLLPSFWILIALIVAFQAVVALAGCTPRQTGVLFTTLLLWLPWLPIPVPSVFLLWTGVWAVPIWLLVGAAIVGQRWELAKRADLAPSSPAALGADTPPGATRRTAPRWMPWFATALALGLYAASAQWLAPLMPDGDAPHYLILAQSLIEDGDIQIENNHRQGDYLAYSLLASQPDYLRRGLNGAIYSIHAPGLPVIIAPAMWLAGYKGVVAFLGLIAACSTGLLWWICWRATGNITASWFGWAACALTTPFFFQATEVFPDGLAATCVLVGTLPLWLEDQPVQTMSGEASRRATRRWVAAGAALALLPWLQTRLAILAGTATLCLMMRMRDWRTWRAFALLPLVSAVGWFAFFYRIYGVVDPTAPYGALTQTAATNLWRGLPGLLFDQQFGLCANAPVYGCLAIAIGAAIARRRRWSIELAVLAVPYVIAVGMYEHWWGGASAAGRFLTPIALVVGLGAARLWHEARTLTTRACFAVALLASVLITSAMCVPEHGHLLINFRDGVALWVEWSHDLLNLPRGLPSLFAQSPGAATSTAGVWLVVAGFAWLALRALERRQVLWSWAAVVLCVASPMVAWSLTWRLQGVAPLTPHRAELALARTLDQRHVLYEPARWRFSNAAPQALRLRVRGDELRGRQDPANVLQAQRLPAGRYRIVASDTGRTDGRLTLRVGDSPLALWTGDMAALHTPALASVQLPQGARTVALSVDRPTAGLDSSVWLESEAIQPSPRARDWARRGALYASRETLFEDDNAYPEPTAFWIAGGRLARMSVAGHGATLELWLRNAPVENVITLDVNDTHQVLTLAPGEERNLSFATTGSDDRVRLEIRTQRGFRPVDVEAGSRDMRYLGCWVQIR